MLSIAETTVFLHTPSLCDRFRAPFFEMGASPVTWRDVLGISLNGEFAEFRRFQRRAEHVDTWA